MKKLAPKFSTILSIFLFLGTLWIIRHFLREHDHRDIFRYLLSLPPWHVALAALFTMLGYVALTFYDLLAIRHVHSQLTYPRIAFASFLSYSFSHNLGMGGLPGHSVRYRLYSAWGLGRGDIARVIVVTSLTFWLGFSFVGGVAFFFGGFQLPPSLHLPVHSLQALGSLFLLQVAAYFGFSALRKKPIRIRRWEFTFPPVWMAFLQILVTAIDWVWAGAALYWLLPRTPGVTFPYFLGGFILSQTLGFVSHVPGGLGVFETVTLFLFTPHYHPPTILGALLAFRVLYYLAPLMTALTLLGMYEWSHRKTHPAPPPAPEAGIM